MSSSLNLNNKINPLNDLGQFCFRHTLSLIMGFLSALVATLALVTILILCLTLTGCGGKTGANGIVMDTSPIKAPSKTPPAEMQTKADQVLSSPMPEATAEPVTDKRAMDTDQDTTTSKRKPVEVKQKPASPAKTEKEEPTTDPTAKEKPETTQAVPERKEPLTDTDEPTETN